MFIRLATGEYNSRVVNYDSKVLYKIDHSGLVILCGGSCSAVVSSNHITHYWKDRFCILLLSNWIDV